ncbi:MAG: hypothetical protein PF961_00665, partial [Planctomycetota bacterium]|nr:hypothetical protein [Planctomycetota bacterium]
MRLVSLALILCFTSVLAAAETWVREPFVVIEGQTVRALVPKRAASAIEPYVRRADQLYPLLAKDADYEIKGPLWLWIGRDSDQHNGFSTVVPFPIVQIELSKARPEQRIFAGGDDFERTLIHELTHHIANDRNRGFRRGLEYIFGRVLPNDPLSMLIAYLSLPPHIFQPRFWHEGTSVWSETTYAPKDTVWAGRGRDSLTHMIWRMDAADEAIPEVGDWKISYRKWPYGGQAYVYGTAYLRYLSGAYAIDIWQLLEHQSRKWPFVFTNGSTNLYGKSHEILLQEARAALLTEQQAQLERLRQQPLTELTRLTPEDAFAGAPVWNSDGSITLALNRSHHQARIYTVDASGALDKHWAPGHFDPALRSRDGYVVYNSYDYRIRASTMLTSPDGSRRELKTQGLQPDLVVEGNQITIATVALNDSLQQRLRIERFINGDSAGLLTTPPQQGDASWSPTWRPGSDDLLWVETDPSGSRLILGQGEQRREFLHLAGRIMHPVWDQAGTEIYFAADHTGVANGYRLSLSGNQVALKQITHVIGGVIAVVQSQDGSELALNNHD